MYRADMKKYMYILLSISLLILSSFLWGKNGANENEAVKQADFEESVVLGIYKEIEVQSGGIKSTRELLINSWYDSKQDVYYLFIPTSVQEEKDAKWKFMVNQSRKITIDGKEIVLGDNFDLENGKYTLSFDDKNKESCLMVLQSENVASLFVDLDTGNLDELRLSKENNASGEYFLFEGDDGTLNYSGTIRDIHSRGNLSFTQTDKKSFTMKIREEDSLMGMDTSNSWILVANSFDDTLSRNHMAYQLANALEMQYVPAAEYVDLFIDGEYQGNYQLSEKVEIAPGRVEIRNLEKETEKLNPEEDLAQNRRMEVLNPEGVPTRKYVDMEFEPSDVKNGYLLELDMMHRYTDEVSGFLSNHYQPVVIKSPEFAGERQVTYIADRYQEMEDALCSKNGYNVDKELYYYDYMDENSFVCKYLLDEVSKNTDSSLSSFFIYVPETDNKFYAGPIWDYDKAFGANEIRDIYSLSDPKGLYAAENIQLEVCAGKDFSIYYILCQQEGFREKYKGIYFGGFRDHVLVMAEEEIMQNAKEIRASAVMNAIRWNLYDGVTDLQKIENIFLNSNETMVTFLQERISFLDEEWK